MTSHPTLWCVQGQKSQLDKLTQWQAAPDTFPSNALPDSATPYLLLLSLFVWSPSQWSASCSQLLLHCLRFAFSQRRPGNATNSGSSAADASGWSKASDEEVWACAFPMIRYFGLIHRLQKQLKGDTDDDWKDVSRNR